MKKRIHGTRIILYMMVLLIVALITQLLYKYLNNYNDYSNNNSKVENKTINEQGDTIETFTIGTYLYTLPENCHYQFVENGTDNKHNIYNNDEKWGSFTALLDKNNYEVDTFINYDLLENKLKSQEKDVRNRQIINRNGLEIVTFNLYYEENAGILAYMPAYDNYIYEVTLYAKDDKTFDYEALNKVIDILANGIPDNN